MRKTIEVAKIKESANSFLLNSKNERKVERLAIQNFVSNLLYFAEKYKGFNYLAESEVEKGMSFGIERLEKENIFHDETRIQFI